VLLFVVMFLIVTIYSFFITLLFFHVNDRLFILIFELFENVVETFLFLPSLVLVGFHSLGIHSVWRAHNQLPRIYRSQDTSSEMRDIVSDLAFSRGQLSRKVKWLIHYIFNIELRLSSLGKGFGTENFITLNEMNKIKINNIGSALFIAPEFYAMRCRLKRADKIPHLSQQYNSQFNLMIKYLLTGIVRDEERFQSDFFPEL